ncbi:MAG: Pyridoxamine 5'-phosphate oxidase-related, FMN-binding [uncultured Thermomicrobiales bacterium]|uniref:Pyridoxamine 5'-phosphate oxidase-related, FMN-binding n=1 Tax=uncultured Thermomicrobiales bacterium TaxID=1645740 RepID=A0A6J4U4X9_9BACT|nr:MAG: Pyridoxamine 5'-phosphate oxidase-related, FMN-binding [uncultured Thermomicrobiales bacterium]
MDAALVCHVGYAIDGQPYVIPTLHARDGDTILLHGHAKARTLLHAGAGNPVCIAVTHVDGLVLARSIFNHSINYRSATLYGAGRLLTGRDEKMDALFRFSEKLLPGRWDDVRPLTEQGFAATAIVAVDIDDAAAKIREGMPKDEPEDLGFPTWVGVVPMRQVLEAPLADEHTPPATPLPGYLAVPTASPGDWRWAGATQEA